MKKSFVFIITFCILMGLYAETSDVDSIKAESTEVKSTQKNTISLSFKLGSFKSDYSLGLGLTSPWFFAKSCAVRLNLDVPFRSDTWRPYLTSSLTVLGGSFMQTANIRLYGGGGMILLYPLKQNEKPVMFGGQGFFGFEFFLSKKRSGLSYFIELGGLGGEFSNKTNKAYPTGFMAHTGFRYNFGF